MSSMVSCCSLCWWILLLTWKDIQSMTTWPQYEWRHSKPWVRKVLAMYTHRQIVLALLTVLVLQVTWTTPVLWTVVNSRNLCSFSYIGQNSKFIFKEEHFTCNFKDSDTCWSANILFSLWLECTLRRPIWYIHVQLIYYDIIIILFEYSVVEAMSWITEYSCSIDLL